MANNHSYLWSFDRYSLDLNGKVFLRDGEPIPLEPKEFELLAYMVKNPKRVLTKEELLNNVWGSTFVEEARITNVVHSIRRKVFRDAGKKYIVTVRDEGYRFDADVQEPQVPDEACPWVGLRAFNEKQARFFYGRDEETQALVERLEREKIIAIVGSSGRGKSSFARAGVIPAVRRQNQGRPDWRVALLRPTLSPLNQLSAALLEITRGRTSKREADTLAKQLADNENGLANHLLNSDATSPARVLFVIDQFEELFSPRVKPNERESFIANIVTGLQASGVDLYVILTIRTDFLQKIEDYPLLWSLVSDRQHGVRRFSRDDLRRIIEKPAEEVGLELEEGLVDEILEELGDAPGALPLLSHTMAELFKQRDGIRLTFRSYRAMGKVRGAIEHHADLVFDSLSPTEQEIAKNVLIRLTDAGLKPGSDAALRLPLDELIADPQRASEIRQVIKKLSDERLLTTDSTVEISSPENEDQRVWVEVSHVALIQHWSRLAGWVNQKRDALRIFHSMDADAKRWRKSGGDPGYLYQEHRLTQALEALPSYNEFVEDLHRDFLQASQELEKEQQQEKARRLKRKRQVKWLKAGLVLSVLVVMGIYLAWQRTKMQRDLANSLRSAADSISQQSFDPELSLLLAIQSGEHALTKQTESSLRQAIAASHVRARYVGHQKQIISVSLSPDGRLLLTGALDKEARIWDVGTGQTLRTIGPLAEGINWASFSPDGSKVVTASRDGVARVWDAATTGLLKELRVPSDVEKKSVNHAIFSPDGTRVLTGGEDGLPRIWDIQTGNIVKVLTGQGSFVNTVAYSPDGKLIGAAGGPATNGEGTAHVWDAQTGMTVGTLPGHQGSVLYISFSPDSKRILTAGKDGTSRVWEVGTWRELAKLTGHSLQVNSAEFSPDGKLILTSGLDGTARVWDATTGSQLYEFLGHESAVNSAIFSRDGRNVFTASGDHTARSWSLDVPQTVTLLRGHAGVVYSSAFSPDGQRIVTAGGDKQVRVWNVRTGELIREIVQPSQALRAVFSPNGTLIATAGGDGVGRIWDTVTGALAITLASQNTLLHSISISNDGSMVATAAADGAVRIWAVQSGNLLREIHASNNIAAGKSDVYDVQFSLDSRSVATAGKDNRIAIWDIASGKNTFDWNVETGEVSSVAFSRDGQFLLAACGDGTARVWDLRDGKAVAVLRGHVHRANSAVFSPDGALILTAGEDQTVRLWEFGVRRMLLQFRGYDSPITYASFSPDGRLIAAADAQGNISLIACEICGASGEELLELAKRHKTRELTPGERERFLRLR